MLTIIMMACASPVSSSAPSYAIIPFISFNSTSNPISSSSSTAKLLTRKHLIIERKSKNYPRKRVVVRGTISIEKETPEAERPKTFLRGGEDGSGRTRFEKMIREAQDSVCTTIEVADGGAKFKEDVWSRSDGGGGGGGISRVLQNGAVWEKAGVNVSVVYGLMPPNAYRAAKASGDQKPAPVPFFAVGISSVLHPKNPFAPTLHFNYRYFETDSP